MFTLLYLVSSRVCSYLLKKSSSGEWQRRYFETNGSFLTVSCIFT